MVIRGNVHGDERYFIQRLYHLGITSENYLRYVFHIANRAGVPCSTAIQVHHDGVKTLVI